MKINPIAILVLIVIVFIACNRSEWPNFLKPEMPVAITYREGFSGYVFNFTNESERTLVIAVLVIDKEGHSSWKHITLKAGETEELSWYDGYPINKGDTVEVFHRDYEDLKMFVR